MQVISPARLLQLWETGNDKALIERTLLLLAEALPKESIDSLAMLSIGDRDELLLKLREMLFGNKLVNTAVCPACANMVEWEMDSRKLHLKTDTDYPINKHFEFVRDNMTVLYRLPNSNDLLRVVSSAQKYLESPETLVNDCIVEVTLDNEPAGPEVVTNDLLNAVDTQIGINDPQADIGMVLNCPACANSWEAKFDIVTYLWEEIDSWAVHFLHEVYLLASAFGWSESDILNMSRQRRSIYLKLVQG